MEFNSDDEPLKFGKYKGETPNEIAKHDPSYIVWIHENTKRHVSDELYEQCCDEIDGEYYRADFK